MRIRLFMLVFAAPLSAGAWAQPADAPPEPVDADAADRAADARDDEVRRRLVELEAQLREAGEAERARRVRDLLEDVQRRQHERAMRGLIGQGAERDEPPAWQAKPLVDPLADTPRRAVVALLGDPDYATRERAERHLLADNTLDRAVLAGLIRSADSDEQRYRLLRVAEHHVMRALREVKFGAPANPAADDADEGAAVDPFADDTAAVGFSYAPIDADDNPHTQTPAVTVIATMPGFPGHAHLRVGDTVIAIDGQTARFVRFANDTRWISNRIRQYAPGDTLVFTIARGGELLDVPIVAAESRALNDMYATNGRDAAFRSRPYETAWDLARRALTEGLAEPKQLVPVDAEAD